MPVTDEQEATLHAALAGRSDEFRRLLDEIDPVAARTGYNALVTAAFSLAVVQRFPEDTTPTQVIEYVADIRARTENLEKMNPRVAERILLAALTDEDIDDIDGRTAFQIRSVLLAAMIGDQQLDAEGLDRFMVKSRKLADKLLA